MVRDAVKLENRELSGLLAGGREEGSVPADI